MATAEPYLPPSSGTLRSRVVVRVKRRPRPHAAIVDRAAIGLLVALTVMAFVTPLLAPHKPNLIAGNSFAHPSFRYLLGTDEVGRDIFSRVLYGLRASWFASLEVITSGVLIGGVIGLVAGTAGGWVDDMLMRVTDVFLALPGPILAIAVVAALGPSLQHTLIAVGIVWWPFYARIVRGEVKALAARPHVEAARSASPCATCCPAPFPPRSSPPASTSATWCSPSPSCPSSAWVPPPPPPSSGPWWPGGSAICCISGGCRSCRGSP